MPPTEITCGSSQCLVEKLEKQLAAQHEDTKEFFEKVIKLSVEPIKEQVEKLEGKIKEYGDRAFPEIRKLQSDVTIIQTELGIKTEQGFSGKIDGMINKHPVVAWMTDAKKFIVAVGIIVIAAGLIGITNWGFSIYQHISSPKQQVLK